MRIIAFITGINYRRVMPDSSYDAVIVGSGPNGLTAGIILAQEGLSVLVLEAKETIGGGARTEQITLPGFHHDICSAIHPVGVVSPVFRQLGLERLGVEWAYPEIPLAHPFDDGSAALLQVSLDETERSLGPDAASWRSLMEPFVRSSEQFFEEILRPIRIPSHPLLMLRFALQGLRSCSSVARGRFSGKHARGLFTGCAAHSILPLDSFATSSFGMVLAVAGHAISWPCARGGSQKIVDALAAHLGELGGEIRTGTPVVSLDQLPPSRALLFDLTPRQIARIAGDAFPPGYRRRLESFRYGGGVFKVDWALDGPIPWKAHECSLAGTVHLGCTFEEISASEHDVTHGKIPDRPFVLVAQQSMFDRTRAPEGKHTGWAYCHVPHGSTVDMTERIERQIERFAPGFRDLILARRTMNSADVERHNPNMIGGDIGGGANDFGQFLFRPTPRWNPYTTPNERIFICSSSTPPGGGVHGMCGYHAARTALRRRFGK
jgi:phytoene dehydrogenase-like protein